MTEPRSFDVVRADGTLLARYMNTKRDLDKMHATNIARSERGDTDWEVVVGPETKKVKSLMTGVEIEIDINTPRCCDPSTELFWSM